MSAGEVIVGVVVAVLFGALSARWHAKHGAAGARRRSIVILAIALPIVAATIYLERRIG